MRALGPRTPAACLVAGSLALAACSGAVRTETPAAGVPDSVTVGYGRVSRAHSTGAVASVPEEEIEARRAARMEDLLTGRLAGVEVRRAPNGGLIVRVRGLNTVNGNAEPLVVIDGMAVESMDTGSVLASISPHDVQRIEVLKDPASLAMYGSRGANGVILITTRR